jgi:4-amino-4-deoxy-L-arabinose transferase-like glycosyltransferase
MPLRFHKNPLQLLASAFAVLFLVLNLWWIQTDQLVRDGDEEGHVGAAELFLQDYQQGHFGTALHRGTVSDKMGDYPSLYPASVGTWWWAMGGGQPSRLPVRSFNLVFLILAAGAVFTMCGRIKRGPALLGAATVLFLPLSVGIARHFMPEGALAACVALAIAAAVRQRESPSRNSALLLGLALGAGFLTKQTFPLYVLAPLCYLLRPHRSLFWAIPGLALAAPWAWNNLVAQGGYLTESAAYAGDASVLGHIGFYPTALVSLGLGPVWSVLLGAAIFIGWKSPCRRTFLLGLIWLFGGILLLSFVPKKYARLMVPLLPACGLIFAAAISAKPQFRHFLLLGVAWTTTASISPRADLRPSQSLVEFEPGQIQSWFRAPDPRGLGFEALRPFAAQNPCVPLVVIDPPELMPHQTTHAWDQHLGPWLRREGLDREVYTAKEDAPPGVCILVDFSLVSSEGTSALVPLLDDQPFSISLIALQAH